MNIEEIVDSLMKLLLIFLRGIRYCGYIVLRKCSKM